MDKDVEMLGALVKKVVGFNKKYNIDNPSTMWNISYLANALTGETGEIADAVKKMLRDGNSDALRENLYEEIVDNQIYIAMLIEATGMDFDKEYEKKEQVLAERFDRYESKGFSIHKNMQKGWED